MNLSGLAQVLLSLALRPRRSRVRTSLINLVLRKLRDAFVVLFNDPLVTYDLDGLSIQLPLSHPLPLIRKQHPKYSKNIGRVAKLLAAKYSRLTMVDIGANVGDTVAIVRSAATFPILCIDGDPEFFSILQRNTHDLPDVYLKNSIVGDTNRHFVGRLESDFGTARVVSDPLSLAKVKTEKLSEILDSFPLFSEPKLIKIDTDGFDTIILRSEVDLLSKLRPVVFFEYDPFFFEQHNDDGFGIFSLMHSIGYRSAMFFINTGEYFVRADLSNKELLIELHHMCKKDFEHRYFDVCLFTDDDMDVSSKLRDVELALPS